MAVRRERGQERSEKSRNFGIGKDGREKRPRIKREPTAPTERKARPRPLARSNKPASGGIKRHTNIPRTPKKIITTQKPGAGTVKEKTSDVFRRNVINRPVGKSPERNESDQFMSRKGKVLRGRFGRKNLYTEQTDAPNPANRHPKKADESTRLNRYIANAGLCSRREADTFIATGCVTVNGKVVSEMGFHVKPGDQVSFNGKIINTERKVYVLLNKPKGYVTTVEDPHAEKTVMDLVKNACPERIYPVGRLDRNTTGLLLITNDGELTKRLTHPKYNRKKIYHVFLDKKVTKAHLLEIVDGVTLEDGTVAADSVNYVTDDDKKQIGIEIHSGKNKVVRRIFEHLGYKVVKLDRVYFCGLTKKNLPRGKWRFLTKEEINLLKMSSQ
jgi:23S rRNA pseudouridine2605 synthase